MRTKERRRSELYKLRVYIDAIKDAKATTDEQWMTQWVAAATPDSVFVPRSTWIAYLEECALKEAEQTLTQAA